MSAAMNPTFEANPLPGNIPLVTFRVCCACNTLHDREEMIQCVTCGEYACVDHTCSCPIEGIEELETV